MIIEDEADAQEALPDLSKINQSNLDKNLIHTSTNDILICNTSNTLKNYIALIIIKTLYAIVSTISFGVGLYIISTMPDIKQYTLIFSYICLYTFIWPIALLATCIIIGLYHLLFKHYHSRRLSQIDMNMNSLYDIQSNSQASELGQMLMMIFLLFCYLISIPYNTFFVKKMLLIRHLYNDQCLIFFMTFFICNIIALVLFIIITYLNYQKRQEIQEIEKRKELEEQKFRVNNTIINPGKIEQNIIQNHKNNDIIISNEDIIIDKQSNKNKKEINGIKIDDNMSMSMRSQCSIVSGKEVDDIGQLEKDKRLLQREKMMKKIELNILQEIDEEDERKNKFLKKIHEQIINEKKAKDDGEISKEIKLEKIYDFNVNKSTNPLQIRKLKTSSIPSGFD